jgi:tetratricopeptide (TPR) repeat protein
MPLRVLALALLVPLAAAAQQSAVSPSAFDNLVSQAAAARDQNDVPRAASLYRQALALHPQWPDGWWYLGTIGYSSSDYASAVDALTHYLTLMPAAGPAFALRGLCEFESADYAASLSDIQHALSLGADNDARNAQILRFHQALLLAHASRFEDALSVYQILARMAPENPELLTAMGLAGLRQSALPAEASVSEQEMALAAGQAAWTFLSGDHDAAARAFADFFARYPTVAYAHVFYAWLLFAHDPAAARVQLEQELHLDAANVPALTLLAWSDILDNDCAAALPIAQRAAALAPDAFLSQLVLGRSLAATGNLAEAIEHLQQALHIDSNNVEVHIGLAIAYSKAGDRDQAREERLRSLAITQSQSVYGQR